MNKIVKNALVLMAFSLVLGFVLGAVYKITEGPIAEAAKRKEMEAYKVVFATADTFQEMEGFDAAAATAVISAYPDTINTALEAVDASGNVLGHVVTLTTKDGYGGGIVITVGIQNDGTVNGFSIVNIGGETIHNAFQPAFADQFKGVKVDKFEKDTNLNYDSVAGASMTANAVVNACNAAIEYTNSLKGGAQ
ncbi:MAG: FMN-binding protein [Agathobacter sp.]|nr:FMN-binding protein [Agathobacter sp.]MBQ3559126.1 FMN-binding protein [Agathobacter sp.]